MGSLTERNRTYQAKYRNSPRGKDRSRRGGLKRLYGLTLEEYNVLLERQHGHCALCNRTAADDGAQLHVDHCKKTNRIRGLLCRAHNTALGQLGDTEQGLAKALAYIRGEETWAA